MARKIETLTAMVRNSLLDGLKMEISLGERCISPHVPWLAREGLNQLKDRRVHFVIGEADWSID